MTAALNRNSVRSGALVAVAVVLAATTAAALVLAIPDGRQLNVKGLALLSALGTGGAAVLVLPLPAALALTTLLAVAGSPRELGPGLVFDTRVVAFGYAAMLLARHATRKEPRRAVREGPVWAVAAAWGAVMFGTFASTVASGAAVNEVYNWLLVGLMLLAVGLTASQMQTNIILLVGCVAPAMVAAGGVAQKLNLPGSPSRFLYRGFEAPRMDSFFGHPNGFASYMAAATVFGLALALRPSASRPFRATGICVALSCAAGVFLSGSRAAVLAVAIAAGIIATAAVLRYWRSGRRDRRVIRFLPIALALVAAVGWFTLGGTLREREASGRLETNNEVRFSSMRTALPLLARDPLIGVGPHQFQPAVLRYESTMLEVPHAHNTLLTLWSERGVAAALGFLGLVFAPMFARRRSRRDGALSLMTLAIGLPLVMVVTSSVDYIFDERASQVGLLTLVVLAVVALAERGSDQSG